MAKKQRASRKPGWKETLVVIALAVLLSLVRQMSTPSYDMSSIPDYDALFDPVRQARQEKSGQQLGDPVKAARAMLAIIESQNPPTHLLLGSDALSLVREKLARLGEEIDRWEALTRSTDG